MGLFKSKQEKEIEQRILIKRTMSNINKYIAQLEQQKTRYIEAAKKAKLKGIPQQYNLAVSGLKTALAQQKKAEEMLLNFELTSQMRDLSSMTVGFLEGMSVLSKEMAKITKNADFVKVQKEFETAMTGVEVQTEKLDAFLESSDQSFEGIAATTTGNSINDEEIEKLINIETAEMENNMDAEIDKKLEEVKKQITDSRE